MRGVMAKEHLGEIPTTGVARPGPMTGSPPNSVTARVRPIAIRIPSIQVDTEVERRPIIDGVMSNPTGPFVIAWYGATGWLGVPGNVVMAGHVDYAGVGPAVLARASELKVDDVIEITGSNVHIYRYRVTWSKLYNAEGAPVDEIAGDSDEEILTLITCGGDFDPATQRYQQRLVIRAVRSD